MRAHGSLGGRWPVKARDTSEGSQELVLQALGTYQHLPGASLCWKSAFSAEGWDSDKTPGRAPTPLLWLLHPACTHCCSASCVHPSNKPTRTSPPEARMRLALHTCHLQRDVGRQELLICSSSLHSAAAPSFPPGRALRPDGPAPFCFFLSRLFPPRP